MFRISGMRRKNSPNLTDQELVHEALKDAKQYGPLVERYYKPLLRYALRLGCPSPDDAKDVLQETFLKAYVNLNDYDDRLKFSSWIYRIAHNETINFFRKEKVRPRVAASEDEQALLENIRDELDLAAEMDKRIERERIERALSTLDKKYQNVLVLKFWEEKSYEEIADILRVPMGTVATLMSRGKKKLKDALHK